MMDLVIDCRIDDVEDARWMILERKDGLLVQYRLVPPRFDSQASLTSFVGLPTRSR